MRICGENLAYKHSIFYDRLPSFFLVFSIWEGTRCLPWNETVEWCELLGLNRVPILFAGTWEHLKQGHGWKTAHHRLIQAIAERYPVEGFAGDCLGNVQEFSEGYVMRPYMAFTLREFPFVVGKYVRPAHVQTHGHWMRSEVTPNQLARDAV